MTVVRDDQLVVTSWFARRPNVKDSTTSCMEASASELMQQIVSAGIVCMRISKSREKQSDSVKHTWTHRLRPSEIKGINSGKRRGMHMRQRSGLRMLMRPDIVMMRATHLHERLSLAPQRSETWAGSLINRDRGSPECRPVRSPIC